MVCAIATSIQAPASSAEPSSEDPYTTAIPASGNIIRVSHMKIND
jgi:hypothetical protein